MYQLEDYIKADLRKEKSCSNFFWIRKLACLWIDPIGDRRYIVKYMFALRYTEYCIDRISFVHNPFLKVYYQIKTFYWLSRLRKLSYITQFQIPPFTVGKGLVIWHWGTIIINPNARIGENCTLNPMVVIGHKNPGEGAPKIGNNVFIGAGSKIIGDIHIGNNVIIGQNVVITNDIPDNTIVVSQKPRIL